MEESEADITTLPENCELSNGVSMRRSSSRPVSGDGSVSPPMSFAYVWQQMVIVVNKDEKGYGMKVSGDNPVYVQSVKEGGAAEKAGLHAGDKILKVNNEDVLTSTHLQVVDLIKSSEQVVLTVQQKHRIRQPSIPPVSVPSPSSPPILSMPSPNLHTQPRPLPGRDGRDRITGPQPVDQEKLRQLENQRVHTFRLMLEKELRYVEALRSEIAKGPEPEKHQELCNAERRVRTLQEQLVSLTSQETCASPQTSPSKPSPHHQRTQSSPDQMNSLNISPEGHKRLPSSESLQDLSHKRCRSTGGGEIATPSPHITPPGTPPPPYPAPVLVPDAHDSSGACRNDREGSRGEPPPPPDPSSPLKGFVTPIISPPPIIGDDEDLSDQEMNQSGDHGPFKSLSKLWEHNAHLAVFLNYIISNVDPCSMLFYLITDLFKEGNAKEMKKWAYEIHSTFLVPGAPLRLSNVDENVAREIDDVLTKDFDKEDIMRKVFFKARLKAKEELNEQLTDFQQKRTAGLGTLFGPSDTQLEETLHDKNKEIKIIEQILVPKLEPFIEEMEREIIDDRNYATVSALSTIMSKVFGVRGPHFSSLLDRCPTFVSKDKSFKAKKLIQRTKRVQVRGHNFVAHQYFCVTYCTHCQLIIWGIGPQGLQCGACFVNVHKKECAQGLEENCPGPMRNEKIFSRIMPSRRKPSRSDFAAIERSKRQLEDREALDMLGDSELGERPVSSSKELRNRPDPVRESEERSSASHNCQDTTESSDQHHEFQVSPSISSSSNKTKPSSINITRSESYKDRCSKQRSHHRERRKTSDPSLSSKSNTTHNNNDVDLDTSQNLSNHSSNSSNSSLSSRSFDSPSNSCEAVSTSRTDPTSAPPPPSSSSSRVPWDSDTEAEQDPPDWTKTVPEDILKSLTAREKKRQEVINELFHTERSHVRALKVLDQVFYVPMRDSQILPPDLSNTLFSNLEEMLDIHSVFNNSMKQKRKDSPLVGDIGELLLDMFDGPAGDQFQRAAATFCGRQQIALESLRERRRKDSRLNAFLNEAELNPLCRRLQLKDIIPTGMQRLTKYPLLFGNLAKYSTDNELEETRVKRALIRSKEILNFVNQAVKEADDEHRLAEIQKRLDRTQFEKVDNPLVNEFRSLDLTKHKLIHVGNLNWRIATRQKLIDLYVLLLEDIIVLLQKQDDSKYVLKFYNVNSTTGERTPPLSPIIKLSTVIVRANAVDRTALYLVNTSHHSAQVIDLVASSSAERKTWFQHISKAADAYKTRDGKNRTRPDPSPLSGHEVDAAGGDSPHSKTKETDESNSQSPSVNIPSNSSLHSSSQLNGPSLSSPDLISNKLERLRRKDETIKQALAEKQQLVADILQVPREDFDTIADLAGEPALNKEASELVLAAVNQANQLSAMVNESLRISEEESTSSSSNNTTGTASNTMPGVPAVKLQVIAHSLNTHLTQLLNLMSERDEERERLRRELQRSRDQVHALHEASQKSSSSRHRSADDPLPPIPVVSQVATVATQMSEGTHSGVATPEPQTLQTEESAELPEYEQPLEIPPTTPTPTPAEVPSVPLPPPPPPATDPTPSLTVEGEVT
uniref:Rho guanine nucleotide exchange factor 12 n=1 Tax=Cacopsylla melanoneura TaxID=428564 RepID=A0A8D9EQ02_9HEMI